MATSARRRTWWDGPGHCRRVPNLRRSRTASIVMSARIAALNGLRSGPVLGVQGACPVTFAMAADHVAEGAGNSSARDGHGLAGSGCSAAEEPGASAPLSRRVGHRTAWRHAGGGSAGDRLDLASPARGSTHRLGARRRRRSHPLRVRLAQRAHRLPNIRSLTSSTAAIPSRQPTSRRRSSRRIQT